MINKGKLIVVSGRSGAGKSTLIGFALKELDKLNYLTTYTTRQKRDGDIGYKYLIYEEYIAKMNSSSNWDNTEVHGNFYGADIQEAINSLCSGINLIVTTYPDIKELKNFQDKYPCEVVSIFIDISEAESKKRLQKERPGHELARVKIETNTISPEVINSFDTIFTPEGYIQKDIARFNKLIEDLIN